MVHVTIHTMHFSIIQRVHWVTHEILSKMVKSGLHTRQKHNIGKPTGCDANPHNYEYSVMRWLQPDMNQFPSDMVQVCVYT